MTWRALFTWPCFEGKVYDVTKFMPDHPGGKKAIMLFAGKAGGVLERNTRLTLNRRTESARLREKERDAEREGE